MIKCDYCCQPYSERLLFCPNCGQENEDYDDELIDETEEDTDEEI